jgi:hypothetical protein
VPSVTTIVFCYYIAVIIDRGLTLSISYDRSDKHHVLDSVELFVHSLIDKAVGQTVVDVDVTFRLSS